MTLSGLLKERFQDEDIAWILKIWVSLDYSKLNYWEVNIGLDIALVTNYGCDLSSYSDL